MILGVNPVPKFHVMEIGPLNICFLHTVKAFCSSFSQSKFAAKFTLASKVVPEVHKFLLSCRDAAIVAVELLSLPSDLRIFG